jgi:hypothetical protein
MVTTKNTDIRVGKILREISSLPPLGHDTSAAPAKAAGDEVVMNPNSGFKKFAATGGVGSARIFGAPSTDRVSAMCDALTNEGEPIAVRGALLAALIKNVCPDE